MRRCRVAVAVVALMAALSALTVTQAHAANAVFSASLTRAPYATDLTQTSAEVTGRRRSARRPARFGGWIRRLAGTARRVHGSGPRRPSRQRTHRPRFPMVPVVGLSDGDSA